MAEFNCILCGALTPMDNSNDPSPLAAVGCCCPKCDQVVLAARLRGITEELMIAAWSPAAFIADQEEWDKILGREGG